MMGYIKQWKSLQERVLDLFYANHDTVEIARILNITEAEAYNLLRSR